MNKQMKQHLEAVVEAIIFSDGAAAKDAFHNYLSLKTQSILLGEEAESDEDKEDKKDDEDKSDDKEDKKDEDKKDEDKSDDKKDKKNPFAKKDKKDDEGDEE